MLISIVKLISLLIVVSRVDKLDEI